MQPIVLNGEKYSLAVFADKYHHTWTGGTSESGDCPRSHTCWQGQGKLILPDKKEFIFEYKTGIHNDISIGQLPPIEKELIKITGMSDFAKVKDFAKIVDLFCEEIEGLIKTELSKGNLFIPYIQIPSIDGKPLIKQALVIEPGYQMEILVA